MSFFSFKIAPGVRVRASRKGLRASIGPRAARVHIGAGRPGVSTGAGPVTLYGSVGGKRRGRSSASGRASIAARQRELAQAVKLQEAQLLAAAFQAIMALHRAEPVPVEPPVAPEPAPVNDGQIRQHHLKAALDGIGLFKRAERARAKSTALATAEVEIAAERARVSEERNQFQAELDERWRALCGNDPDAVLATICEAFEDNEAPGAALGVDADELAIVVLVPGPEAVPERIPQTTAAGNLSMPKLPKGTRAAFYTQLVCGHLLATVREAFAVAPGIMSVRAAAIRLSELDAYGNAHPECLIGARFARQAFDGVQWATADAGRIVLDTSIDLLINVRGQAKELLPLDLSREPHLAALIDAVDLDDLTQPDPPSHTSKEASPQFSKDGQWWWDGHRWIPATELRA